MAATIKQARFLSPCYVAIVALAAWSGPGHVFAQSANTPNMGDSAYSASESQQSMSSVSAYLGYHPDYRKATLAYDTPALWTHTFQGGSRLDLNLELSAAYWEAAHNHSDSMWQLSLKPVLRWWTSENFFLETGVGPSGLTSSHFGGREFGSRFQFNSHIGAGYVFQKAHRISLRYSHSSNGGIKRPNPGLDVLELGYSYQF